MPDRQRLGQDRGTIVIGSSRGNSHESRRQPHRLSKGLKMVAQATEK